MTAILILSAAIVSLVAQEPQEPKADETAAQAEHSHDGHTHTHNGEPHTHDGHTHTHDGHAHTHDGHTHTHDQVIAEDDLGWRSIFRCGPNSLFVLLRMVDKNPDYDKLVADVDITNKGASAQELVRVAEANGYPLVALKVDSRRLADMPLPAIVHTYNPDHGLGHYVLLLSYDVEGDSFTIVECTRGDMEIIPRGDFLDRWSGVILVSKDKWKRSGFDTVLWLVSGISLLLSLYMLRPIFMNWLRRNNDARKGEKQDGAVVSC